MVNKVDHKSKCLCKRRLSLSLS